MSSTLRITAFAHHRSPFRAEVVSFHYAPKGVPRLYHKSEGIDWPAYDKSLRIPVFHLNVLDGLD